LPAAPTKPQREEFEDHLSGSPGRRFIQIPLEDLIVGARFVSRLPAFLRYRIDVPRAQVILQRRLERREDDFLDLVRRAIYDRAASPYRQLLGLAGCEYGDLERLVRQEGLEGALRTLLRHGVYLTVDEFKGRQPVVRGSVTLCVNPEEFQNPLATAHLLRYRSGSRGESAPVPVDLASVRDRAVNLCLTFSARGGIVWQHAYWEVPGGASMVHVLECIAFGARPDRWFSQLDPATPGLHPRYRWSGRLMRWGSVLAGVPLPRPEHVSLEDPTPIARWMLDVLRNGRTPHLKTYASSAVRLCQAALAAGLDLHGAKFTVTGEPVTEARLAAIQRVGAEAVARCGTSEAGVIGSGCLTPEAPDELHFYHDLNAMIQPGDLREVNGLSPRSLLITSLRPAARLILLNVSLGDEAHMIERTCGCPMEAFGWTTHIHTLRSFEKLTAAGMTFLDTDVIRVLEEVLPAHFGGGPTRYQLVEQEAADGRPRLRLLVHPTVGPLDADAVADVFLTAIGYGSGVERVMGLLWRQARIVEVVRRAPLTNASGKILHLHLGT